MTAHIGTNTLGATPRRVTVVAPHTRVDVALPLLVTVAELVPQLVALAGLTAEAAGVAGWHLSRLGGGPLDPADSVAAAGILDGEVLYLTPRGAHLPPAVFDDVVDAVAEDAERRSGSWQPGDTVRTGLVAGGLAVLFGLTLSLVTGPGRGAVSAILAAASAAALILAALLARTKSATRVAVGGVIAAAGVGAAALAAALIVGGRTAVSDYGPAELLGAAAAGTFAAGIAAALVRRYTRGFVTIAVLSAVALVAAAVAVSAGGAQVAAVIAALALAFTAALPITALRLARLAPAPVPADMESFRAHEGPTAVNDVADRAGLAEQMLTALIAGQVAVLVAGTFVVAFHGVAGRCLAAVIGVTLLLRARTPRGRAQRWTLIVGGAASVLVATVATGTATGWQPMAAYTGGAVLVAALAFAFAVRAPRRQPSPHISRLLDAVEFLTYAAVLPVAAAVLGLYQVMRDITG